MSDFAKDTNVPTNDCVSRQAAIDALHRYFDGMLETDTWSPCDVYGLIEILPSAQPEPRWIPCSERLPELDNSYSNSKEYLVQWDNGRIDITRYSNVNIFWQNETTEPYWKGEQYSKVVAWMPLPEPYKGEES